MLINLVCNISIKLVSNVNSLTYNVFPFLENNSGFQTPWFNPEAGPSSGIGRSSSLNSLGPHDSASVAGGSYSRPPSRISFTSVTGQRHVSAPILPMNMSDILYSAQPWTPERKKHLETALMRLTASCGFPLSWTSNAEWKRFCDEFIPGAPVVTGKVLTTRILPSVSNDFRNQTKADLAGKQATLQSDGWTGINNHHLVAYGHFRSKGYLYPNHR